MKQAYHYLFTLIFLMNYNVVAQQSEEKATVIQNIESRDVTSLKGLWQAIVDPLENGYYNHRYLAKGEGWVF